MRKEALIKPLVLIILVMIAAGIGLTFSSNIEMVRVAADFVASLDSNQKSQVTFEMGDSERFNWHYIPRERKGVSLKQMSPAQKKLAFALLSTALSGRGMSEASQIMFLEQILYEMENQSPRRDPDGYFFSIFGRPSRTEPWGWRVEGHHLSLNIALEGSKVVATSPAFYGANPAIVKSGPHAGMQVLRAEQEWGRQLVQSFSRNLLEKVVIDVNAPDDVITGFSREFDLGEPVGASLGEMGKEQVQLLTKLIHRYAERFKPDLSGVELEKLEAQGLEKIHFAWAGGTKPGDRHYYRIHGPTFVIEYDNTQDQANHIHSVWRDIDNDFAKDVLKEHYEHSHQGVDSEF